MPLDQALLFLSWLSWIGYAYLLWRWGLFPHRPASFSPTTPQESLPPSLTTSLLIPARNEATTLPRCLDSLLQQKVLPDEILIIDDHSEDGTPAAVRPYLSQRVHLLTLPPTLKGKKAALSLGIQRAQGAILITTDADTVHPPDSIEKLLHPFANPIVQVVGGWIRLQPEESFLNAFQRIELAGVLMLTAGSWRRGEPLTANGALLAYRRKAFEAVGGWGRSQAHPSGDDDLLVQRIRLKYGPLSVAFSEAVVETGAAPTWRAFFHQRLRWLSKRHLYPALWTKVALSILGLAQLMLVVSLFLAPAHSIVAWLFLSLLQSYIARKALLYMQTPLPKPIYWLLTAIVYPFYQTFMIILALWRPSFEWKGRRYGRAAQKA
ncbi:MAG: glycosyltransferase [Bacteroidia bacterium]|nr:glycosyltransferase [Bacteroidia bacterium]